MNRKLLILLALLILLLGVLPAAAQDDMAQTNKDTYLSAIEAYNTGTRDAYYDLLADPFMMNQGETTLGETTRADVEGYDGALVAAMPDLQMTPEALVAQGSWLAVAVTYTGTFTQPFSFPPISPEPFPPNDAAVQWSEMDFLHFDENGLIDLVWATSDPTVMFGQLGIFPPSEDEEAPSGDVIDGPAGYQLLDADALAATFTSGMEERNLATTQTLLEGSLLTSTAAYYTNPYVAWDTGVAESVDPTAEEADPFLMAVSSAMPDLSAYFEVRIAEGDWAAYLITLNGTFTGEVDLGPGMTLSPTGETISWQVGFIERFDADGLITEEWFAIDPTPLAMGLGLMDMGE